MTSRRHAQLGMFTFETGDERLALKNLLEDVFKPFGAQRAALVDALLYWMDVQHQTLILGEVDGQRPDDIVKRNAQAYLSGTGDLG